MNIKNVLSGLLFLVISVPFLFLSLNYEIGSISAMGPGFIPLAASSILTLFGVVILIKEIFNVFR